LEIPNRIAQSRKRDARCTTDIDDVSTGRSKVIRQGTELGFTQPGRVVDLGQDFNRVGPVLERRRGLPEVARNLAEILGTLFDHDAKSLLQNRCVAFAQPGDQNQVDIRRDLQVPGNPGGGHQRGHGNLQYRDNRLEWRGHLVQHTPERRLRECTGDKQNAMDGRTVGQAVGSGRIICH
jgi:hypothetical protein